MRCIFSHSAVQLKVADGFGLTVMHKYLEKLKCLYFKFQIFGIRTDDMSHQKTGRGKKKRCQAKYQGHCYNILSLR